MDAPPPTDERDFNSNRNLAGEKSRDKNQHDASSEFRFSLWAVVFSGGLVGALMFAMTLPSLPLYLASVARTDPERSAQFLG